MKSKKLEVKKTLLKLDTGGEGMNAIFRDWQLSALSYLINHEEGTSAEVLAHIEWHTLRISRASVIQFLNKLVDEGLVTFREETAKGGYRRVYALGVRNWEDFNNTILDRFLFKLWEIFPDNERIKRVLAQ